MSGPQPSGDWQTLARRAAAEVAQQETILRREFLVLELAGDLYALPVERVREIVRLRPVTPMPRVSREVLGVIPLRSGMVQVVDLRTRLSLDPPEPGRRGRIVVVLGAEGEACGLVVDAVIEVMRVAEDALCPAPAGECDLVAALCRRAGRFVSVLDVERVLDLEYDGS